MPSFSSYKYCCGTPPMLCRDGGAGICWTGCCCCCCWTTSDDVLGLKMPNLLALASFMCFVTMPLISSIAFSICSSVRDFFSLIPIALSAKSISSYSFSPLSSCSMNEIIALVNSSVSCFFLSWSCGGFDSGNQFSGIIFLGD